MTETKLEKDLRLAATGEGSSAEFYQTLMNSEIFVFGNLGKDSDSHVTKTLDAGSDLNIQSVAKEDGTEVIPFFTSLTAMQKFVKSEKNYVALSAADFFNITLGADLVLNPRSDHSKEFPPHEVSLLLGRPDAGSVTKHTTEEKIPVSIGQPAEYPQDLVDTLSTVLPLYEDVDYAFLAQIIGRDGTQTPEIAIGLQSRSEIGSILPELANHIEGKTADERAVLFIRVEPEKGGMARYMVGTPPFYRKKAVDSPAKEKPKRKSWFKFKS